MLQDLIIHSTYGRLRICELQKPLPFATVWQIHREDEQDIRRIPVKDWSPRPLRHGRVESRHISAIHLFSAWPGFTSANFHQEQCYVILIGFSAGIF